MPKFAMPPTNPSAPFTTFRASHFCLRVPDYAEARQWFIDKLDFRVVHEWHEPMLNVDMGYLAAANDDRCVIELVGGNDPRIGERASEDFPGSFATTGLHHFCFTVPSVDQTIEDLRTRGVTISVEPFEVEAIGRRLAFFADPWGNLFELEEVLG